MTTLNHELTVTADRYGRCWTCTCGLWDLRADYGWTNTHDHTINLPVAAYTPAAARHHHIEHRHHAENPTEMRHTRRLRHTPKTRH